MKIIKMHRLYFAILIFILMCIKIKAQTSEQKSLENKREHLQKEIKEINRLLFAEKKERGNILDELESLEKKINVRQQLIRVTNRQTNLLNRQLNANIKNISKFRDDLKKLKEEYAKIIEKAYKNKSQQNHLIFLLSSESFFQAFKRVQYIKQYTKYRKEQGERILIKTKKIAQLNENLIRQRKIKEKLIVENTVAKKKMLKEKSTQRKLLKTIRKNEVKYMTSIRKKKKQSKELDKQIEKMIRIAIITANKKKGKTTNDRAFVLTPEAKKIAANFYANKGKLIWPVEKGLKTRGFGVYRDALYPGIKHVSNGVTIITDKGAEARAIFKGKVLAIMSVPGGNMGVQIKHGNYISTYYNLSKVYVKKGDIVMAKEMVGEIYANHLNGKTQLKFYLYKNTTRLNPEEWIYQL